MGARSVCLGNVFDMGTAAPAPETLRRYLSSGPGQQRRWAFENVPLQMKVEMPVEHWRANLAKCEIASSVRSGVEAALEAAQDRCEVVTRSDLMALSAAATDSNSAVTAWLTTMCWGAGPRDKFRLRQWREALCLDDLPERLLRTIALVGDGDLVAAHRTAHLPGCAESYFTKWLWACGLPPARRAGIVPLVYDDRVKKVLSQLGALPSGKNAAHRWVNYCSNVAEWAEHLNGGHPGWAATADTLEQLLFERNHSSPCLHDWLQADLQPV